MDSLSDILRAIIGFLLDLLTLFVNFFIAALKLVLEFAQAIVGSIS